MKTFFTNPDQGGFTLIELVVVIVILGTLSATALPKFANLAGDARAATLKAAKGAMISAAALAHARFLLDRNAATVTLEGVEISLTNGYPAVGTAAEAKKFAELAGLGANDYVIQISKGELKVRPQGVAATNVGHCFVSYGPPPAAGAAPEFKDGASTYNCN